MADDDLRLSDGTTIDQRELVVTFARSGGPGGQHVNTSATRVELRFDVANSTALDDSKKRRIIEALAGRLTGDGVLIIHAGEYRSQARNREAAVARLRAILERALRRRAQRRPTSVPARSRRARSEAKRRRSERKRLRRPPPAPDS